MALVATSVTAVSRAHDPLPPDEEEEGGLVESTITHSPYEVETIEIVLAQSGGTVEPAPEGKTIESIEVWPLDVLEPRDPLPRWGIDFLNWFHVTSRPFTVRREVLFGVGEPYRHELAAETERNLRSIRQFSLALVVPLRGKSPDTVRVIVITKDIWSLRMNTSFRIAGGELERLLLQPSEENLFGTHHSASGQFILEPDAYSLGGRYSIPRIADSRIEGVASVNVILNRDSGQAEGSFGSLSYGQPLYSKDAEWAWGGVFAWRQEVTRRHIGIQLAAYDAEVTPDVDLIPYVYDSDLVSGSYEVTRSFGRLFKNDVTVGAEAARYVYRAPDLTGFDPAAVAEFQREVVPVSDTRIYPFIRYETYTTRYAQLLDVDTLALQEDYHLGHNFILKLYPVTRALNSTRDFMGVFASASYTVLLGNGLARALVESTTEIEEERLADASVLLGGRVVSPSFVIGRLVVDLQYLDRYRNYLNEQTSLGGDTRLRGYPTESFIGEDYVVGNLEFRSSPLSLWTVQVAGTAFFDAGDAFDGPSDLDTKQSTGIGLRVLFPQLDRTVLRADWGLPLTKVPELGITGPFPGDVIVTFRQAFPTPAPPLTEP